MTQRDRELSCATNSVRVYQMLVGEHEERRPLSSSGHRRENVEVDLKNLTVMGVTLDSSGAG